jgi:hypothetical protein
MSLYLNENLTSRTQMAEQTTAFFSEAAAEQARIVELDKKLADYKQKHQDSLSELAQLNWQVSDRTNLDLHDAENRIGAILTMAAGTLLRLRLSQDRRFELTPLDLIVLFAALVIPSLPDTFGLPVGGALGITKLVVLFYALEALVSRVEMRVVWLRIAASTLLAGLVVRTLL